MNNVAQNWTVEDHHGNASGAGMTREQAKRVAQENANRDGVQWFAVGPDGEFVAMQPDVIEQ